MLSIFFVIYKKCTKINPAYIYQIKFYNEKISIFDPYTGYVLMRCKS